MTMKVLHDYGEFFRKVGLLCDLKYSYGIDLEPCWGVLGLFKPHRLPELKKYIEEHPEYHIISEIDDSVILNRLINNSFGYYLAEGDKDPELTYVPYVDPVEYFDYETHFNDDSRWLDPLKLRKNKGFSQF